MDGDLFFIILVKLAEWSKASDLSSDDNKYVARVRIPYLTMFLTKVFFCFKTNFQTSLFRVAIFKNKLVCRTELTIFYDGN